MPQQRSPGEPRATATLWRLVRYARPYIGILAIALLCAGAYAGARAGRAWLMQPLLDGVIVPASAGGSFDVEDFWGDPVAAIRGDAGDPAPAGDASAETTEGADLEASLDARIRDNLPRIAWAALLIITLLPLAHLGQLYFSQYLLGRVLVDLQQDLCAKLLSLPLRFHHQASRGDVLSRVTNDTQRAHVSLDHLLVDVLQSLVTLVVGSVVLLLISWQLTLFLALVAPIVGGVIALFSRTIRHNAKRRQETQGDLTSRLVQILSGIKVIKAFAAEPAEQAAFADENLRLFRRGMRVVRSRAYARTIVEAINNTIGIAVLLGGAFIVAKQLWGLSAGALGAYVLVMQSTYRPVKDLSKGWTRLVEALPSAERFFELLDAEPTRPDVEEAVSLERIERGVRLSKVSFSYDDAEPALRDVSLKVPAGEVVALVGRTGSGKTTLADLLLRFHDPDAGSIEVDGVDLRRIRRRSWLERIAVVTQDPFLFPGTIRDNIRYGSPDASEDAIREAARVAHVDEFAEALPRGYDTEVGDAGVRLSGGQRQRITIARAILRDPDLLVFDEATSALDAKSERLVQDAIDAMLSGRTVFVIAHRLSTIRHADRIVVLDDGAIAESGTHDELIARQGGLYRELVGMARAESSLRHPANRCARSRVSPAARKGGTHAETGRHAPRNHGERRE